MEILCDGVLSDSVFSAPIVGIVKRVLAMQGKYLATGVLLALACTHASAADTSRIATAIDDKVMVALPGHTLKALTPERDLGAVDDSTPLRLYLSLKRTPEQQAQLDALIAHQQQPGAAEYHKWVTPQEYGARFGVAPADIAKISVWLESKGFKVKSVLNNASVIDFAATAGGVRAAFRTEIHKWNIENGTYPAVATEPSIPVALSGIVAGIEGLNKIPRVGRHTPIRPVAYDAVTHRWHDIEPTSAAVAAPHYAAGGGQYNVTPQDFYTIYNVNKVFATGNMGAGVTIAVPEPTDMNYGTVGANGTTAGGDVATFRKLLGVPGTLNMQVLHGYGTVTCSDPGITAAAEGEATLDAEWANAAAPSAKLIFMSCDSSQASGDTTSMLALIDGNLADVIGDSYGSSELLGTPSQYSLEQTMFAQAAAQGQTIIVAEGDAGSDDADQNAPGAATSGINVDDPGANPLVTSAGGTDFQDSYDADLGGPAQSTYWGATNSQFYADALGYIPETVWNSSCASSLFAEDFGSGATPQAYCSKGTSTGLVNGSVVGGGGGFSVQWSQPAWQAGTPGLSASATQRAVPDISLFASPGSWGHSLIDCDSTQASTACTSPSTFGGGGGTSYVSPQLTGITGLLVAATGSRQGLLNPTLYALAKAQYTAAATKSACYANGQTANTGVTKSLPASTCIFNDVTTSNNDVPCAKGSTNCYVQSGASYGLLSTTGASQLTVAYPAGANYDEATGLGSINVYNLITMWDTAFNSATALTATPTTITTAQSSTLQGTVTTGTPPGYDNGAKPAVTGSIKFVAGVTTLGSCTVSGGTCSLSVAGSALQVGSNSITATFLGSPSYPSSTSSVATVTVTAATAQTITFAAISSQPVATSFTLHATASSGLQITYISLTPHFCAVSGSTLSTLVVGSCTVAATQPGNATYSPASSAFQTFSVTKN
jgi:subtilase family serine protease